MYVIYRRNISLRISKIMQPDMLHDCNAIKSFVKSLVYKCQLEHMEFACAKIR